MKAHRVKSPECGAVSALLGQFGNVSGRYFGYRPPYFCAIGSVAPIFAGRPWCVMSEFNRNRANQSHRSCVNPERSACSDVYLIDVGCDQACALDYSARHVLCANRQAVTQDCTRKSVSSLRDRSGSHVEDSCRPAAIRPLT